MHKLMIMNRKENKSSNRTLIIIILKFSHFIVDICLTLLKKFLKFFFHADKEEKIQNSNMIHQFFKKF
jgi:hypothetical protein